MSEQHRKVGRYHIRTRSKVVKKNRSGPLPNVSFSQLEHLLYFLTINMIMAKSDLLAAAYNLARSGRQAVTFST